MTERKPRGMSFESWIDRQIREAQERGEFDNLPGAGKPLENLGRPHDEMWWIRQKLESEGLSTEAALPTPLRLRKEIARLRETVRDLPTEQAVRDEVRALNTRVLEHLRAPSGPEVPVTTVNVDDVVEQWRTDRSVTKPKTRTEPTPAPAPERPRRRWWHWRRGSRADDRGGRPPMTKDR